MNQILAMLFPLVGIAAVGLTALWVVKPWKKARRSSLVIANNNIDDYLRQKKAGRSETVESSTGLPSFESFENYVDEAEALLDKQSQAVNELRKRTKAGGGDISPSRNIIEALILAERFVHLSIEMAGVSLPQSKREPNSTERVGPAGRSK